MPVQRQQDVGQSRRSVVQTWRPYTSASVWNTPVSPGASVDPSTTATLKASRLHLSSDPRQYTMPVYEVSTLQESAEVVVRGTFTDVGGGGRTLRRTRSTSVRVPLPPDLSASPGSDAQVVLIDRRSGAEWGFWRMSRAADGTWTARNAYHYDITWDGAPPAGFGSRGAGVPYLAGLVRRDELLGGEIRHALAFGYPAPSCAHVFPATKSDGPAEAGTQLAEGLRLQLDPTLEEPDFDRWGLSPEGRVIARALQRYGMFLVDVSGRPKIYLEAQETARWPARVSGRTVAGIPLSAFRALTPSATSTQSC